MNNPFVRARKQKKHIKALVYGATGTGKTTWALQFPKVCLLDLEKGADFYGDSFEFDTMQVSSWQQAQKALSFLKNDNGVTYETLVIDPITVLWELVLDKWATYFTRDKPRSAGNHGEYYDFQVKDWATIKSDWKKIMQHIIMLPMNVVCLAREKSLYSDNKRDFMKVIGKTIDCEKSVSYLFDIVLNFTKQDNQHIAVVEKDRTNVLPSSFPVSFEPFTRIMNPETLEQMESRLKNNTAWLNQKYPFGPYATKSWKQMGERNETRHKLHILANSKKFHNNEIKTMARLATELVQNLDKQEAPGVTSETDEAEIIDFYVNSTNWLNDDFPEKVIIVYDDDSTENKKLSWNELTCIKRAKMSSTSKVKSAKEYLSDWAFLLSDKDKHASCKCEAAIKIMEMAESSQQDLFDKKEVVTNV